MNHALLTVNLNFSVSNSQTILTVILEEKAAEEGRNHSPETKTAFCRPALENVEIYLKSKTKCSLNRMPAQHRYILRLGISHGNH